MKCHICDKELSDKETNYNEDLKGYEPCTICLDIAMDAAYGQHTEDDEYIILDGFDGDASDIIPRLSDWDVLTGYSE